jgi:hypothetical protein
LPATLKKYGVEVLTILIFISAIMNHNRSDRNDANVLKADALGYYAYLPAVFIYHDSAFSFKTYYEDTYYGASDHVEFRNKVEGHYVNKYFSGVALMQLPFFLIAHSIALVLHLPADGYSTIYNWALIIAAVFYLFLAFKALKKLLLSFHDNVFHVLAVIAIIYFGTNLFHYSAREPGMSHLFIFSVSCVFALALYRLCFTPAPKWVVLSLVCFGLIIAIRPVDVLMVGLFPIVAGSWRTMWSALQYTLKNPIYLIAGLLLSCIPSVIQSILWHWQTGHYFVYSYGNEGFNWSRPEIINILFSYSRGWFVYTPVAFIGLLGILLYWRKDKFRVTASLIFIAVAVYVLSCWWWWSFGCGFGHRAFIDFLLIPALGLTWLFKMANKSWMKMSLLVLGVALIALNQIQDLQYRRYIFRWNEMDRTAYWKIFLKTSYNYDGIVWQDANALRVKTSKGIRVTYENNFDAANTWMGGKIVVTDHAFSGRNVAEINHDIQTSPVLQQPLMPCDTAIQAAVWFYGGQPDNSVLSVKMVRNTSIIMQDSTRLLIFSDRNNTWTEAVFHKRLPKGIQPGDMIQVYVSNAGSNERLMLDNFKVDMLSACKP